MKTSIRSRLFLISYGIILLFIVGLIVLSNTFLSDFYTKSREKNLILAFNESIEVDLESDEDTLASSMLAIENKYNIAIQVLKQNPTPYLTPPFDPDLPAYVDRIYGSRFSIRGDVLATIVQTFNDQLAGASSQDVDPIIVTSDTSYIAYLAEIIPSNATSTDEDAKMLALCVAQKQEDDLYLYYIFTITIQSISDSIAIFNSFTIFVGLTFMILAGIGTFIYSRRFTDPILMMTDVTRDLANLDFSKKVLVSSQDELGVLGQSINKMSSQLEISIKELQSANEKLANDIELKNNIDMMRKEFIANASHELKTPISLIIGYSEALRLQGLSEADIADYLNIIDDEANKMNKLVMNLLKISQLETGFQQLNLLDFSLMDLTEETAKLFSIKMNEKKVNFQIDVEDQFINSDYDSLQTVLTNYLSNALNHIEGEMIIRLSSSRLEDGSIRINVFNTGTKIPEDSLDRIWESFYKVDKARTRAYGGQGLGLSIVRGCLSNLNYKYGVTNKDDGVEFFFDIPPESFRNQPNP